MYTFCRFDILELGRSVRGQQSSLFQSHLLLHLSSLAVLSCDELKSSSFQPAFPQPEPSALQLAALSLSSIQCLKSSDSWGLAASFTRHNTIHTRCPQLLCQAPACCPMLKICLHPASALILVFDYGVLFTLQLLFSLVSSRRQTNLSFTTEPCHPFAIEDPTTPWSKLLLSCITCFSVLYRLCSYLSSAFSFKFLGKTSTLSQWSHLHLPA